MKEELQAAVDFMCNSFFTFKANPNIELNKIKETLTQILQDRYKDHWYVDKPLKGQAYRCIRLRKNDKNHDYIVDLLIKKIHNLNLNIESCLCKVDITLWIDPGEVSYRYGESLGNTFTIYQTDSSSTRRTESHLSSSESGSPSSSVSSLITSPLELETKPIEDDQRLGKSVSQANTIDNHHDEIFDFVALAPSSETHNFTSGLDDTSQQKDVELQMHQLDINKLTHMNIWTPAIHYSCSPSSYSTESSSSMCSNASDGTRTPVSTYGDSERSDTPSTLHNDQQQPNKSYCGYVESYPYYYKLSRLYNALTIQKMQSDRLRKQLIGSTNKHPQLNQTKQPKQSLKQNKTHKSQSQSRLTNAVNIPIQQQVSPSVTPPKSPYRQNSSLYGQLQQSASPLNYMFYNQIQHMVPEINQAPQTMSTVTATQSATQQQVSYNSYDSMNWIRGNDLIKLKT